MAIVSITLFGIAIADPFITYGTDYYLRSGYDIFGQGSSSFNWAGSTGSWVAPSGTFTMTNGATISAGKSLVELAGAGGLTVGTGGITPTSGLLHLNGPVNISGSGTNLIYSSTSFMSPVSILGSAGIDVGGNVNAVKVNASSTSRVGGAVYDMSTLGVTSTATVNALAVNTTSAFTQQATMAQALKVTARNLAADYNETLNSAKDGAIFMDCASANKTVILQTPTAMGSGALITIKAVTGPVSGYLKVTTIANGTNTISGSKMWISTDDTHLPAITLMSNGGTSYWVVSTYGNWTTTTK
jgi:hypothetical protein